MNAPMNAPNITRKKVTKAIIPVAGVGTRFLPATKSQPKEMLPIVDKPVIQYIVEDIVAAGIEEIIFVTSNGKRALEDHFDRSFELEFRLLKAGKKKELREIIRIEKLAKFAFVRQDKPLGDGHAVLAALPFLPKDEPVFLALGDNIITGMPGIAAQLVGVYNTYQEPVVAAYEVPESETHHYGIMSGIRIAEQLWRISGWVEKPRSGEAPSNMAWPGFAVVTPEILNCLEALRPTKDGEIRNADAFKAYFGTGGSMLAHILRGQVFDCGNKLEFIKAQLYFGLQNPEMEKDLRAYIKKVCNT